MPIKSKWKDAVLEWRTKNPNKAHTKEDFVLILSAILNNIDLSRTLKNGFRALGLHPWNANAIDYSKCLGKRSPKVSVNISAYNMIPLP